MNIGKKLIGEIEIDLKLWNGIELKNNQIKLSNSWYNRNSPSHMSANSVLDFGLLRGVRKTLSTLFKICWYWKNWENRDGELLFW